MSLNNLLYIIFLKPSHILPPSQTLSYHSFCLGCSSPVLPQFKSLESQSITNSSVVTPARQNFPLLWTHVAVAIPAACAPYYIYVDGSFQADYRRQRKSEKRAGDMRSSQKALDAHPLTEIGTERLRASLSVSVCFLLNAIY